MKKGFLYQVIVNKKIVFFITAIIFIGGMASYITSVKQESPDFEVPVVIINLTYIGSSANEVENYVMRPLETDLSKIENIEGISTFSRSNGGSLFIEFDYDADRREAFDQVRKRLDDMLLILPEEVNIVSYLDGNLNVIDFMYILTSSEETVDMEALKDQADKIQETLENYSMVSSVDLQGQQEEKIYIKPKEPIFSNLPLTRYDLSQVITALNSALPGGRIEDQVGSFVQSTSGLKSLNDLEDYIIGLNPVTEIPMTLSDIANIEKVYEDTFYTNYNGQQGILIYGYYKDNLDMTRFAKGFKEDVRGIPLKDGFELNEILYYPDDVKASNNDFFMNLLMGMLLVVLISFISMGIRNAVVVSLALPTSVMMSMIAMRILGIKLHQVSIAAMIIAIGMLVDNAIVITESIKSYIEDSVTPISSALLGTKEVMIPVLTSTLTTIAAFSPLLFLPSIAGDYIKSVPQVIIIALSASYLVSITLMPSLSFVMFKKREEKKEKGRLIQFITHLIRKLLNYRILILISILLVSVFSITLLPKMGLSFFPTAEKNIVYVNVQNKSQGMDDTREKMATLEAFFSEVSDIKNYVTSVGIGLPRFWDTMRPYYASQQFGQFLLALDLTDQFKTNTEFVVYLQEQLNEIDENLIIDVHELEKSEPVLAPITIQLLSPELDKLGDAKAYTISILSDIEGVQFIRDDDAQLITQYNIDYDLNALSSKGLLLPNVQVEILYGLDGTIIGNLSISDQQVPMILSGGLASLMELKKMVVGYASSGGPVLLEDIAEIQAFETKGSINRYNGAYKVNVLADLEAGYSVSRVMEEFKDNLDPSLHQDVQWQYDGELESIFDNFSDLGLMAMFAGFLILIIIVIQFKSFRQTAVILLSIPLAAAGSIYGLYVTGYEFSFTALFGMVSLMGIVVNNAILLLDSINHSMSDGLDAKEAAIIGAQRRIRPIFLTSVTTVMGLIPLMLSGSDMFAPMAIAIASGLIFSTLITLLYIPIVYGLVYKNLNIRKTL